MIAFNRVVDAFRQNGLNVKENGHGKAQAQAPGHSPADLSVTITNTDGQCLVYSHSDPTDQVLESLSLTQADLFDQEKGVDYEYPDGRKVHRTTDKKFRQSGETKGTQLYRADRIGDATTVYVPEGEKDVHALEALGVTAVCTAMGAGKANLFDLTPLYGKHVIVVRDMDAPGAEHAKQLVELLAGHATVEVMKPKEGKDAADHVSRGLGIGDLEPDDSADHIQLIAAMRSALSLAETQGVTEAMSTFYKTLDAKAAKESTSGLKDWSTLVDEWWDWTNSPEVPGKVIPTPWEDLNNILAGGLHAGRSYLIAGRPGGGKSLGITNIAAHAAQNGAIGLIYTVEMGNREITSRILSAGSIAEYSQITKRELTQENLGNIALYCDDTRGMKLWVNDNPAMTISKIRQEARMMKAKHGLNFIAIDYLQILKPEDSRDNRERQISEISQAIKVMSRELDVACLTAAQVNRGNAKDMRPPTIADLRESGSLEQDADVVILLHHEMVEQGPGLPPLGTGDVRFILGKNRTGPQTTLDIPWRPHYAKIG